MAHYMYAMGMKCGSGGLLVLLAAAAFACMFAAATPTKNCTTGYNAGSTAWNHTNSGFWGFAGRKNATLGSSRRIIVGGSEQNWRFGFNYTDWAIKNAPFYLNDTLVFKYDPPNDTTFPHSVYLLPNFWSFQNCDLKRAKKIGEVSDGGGDGFEFVLKRWQPHYFACGERDGFHCKVGLMKFGVWPLIPGYN
ncbi:uncharacterized protein LOC105172848 [Sesamum indicum]|uniref:Uncharacterized protein LOC105155295 n=1 Tax=Sesamum indicum TaxID=4182 RepID=A0A6I9U1P1_SESIN|nr:uncharacterized protein LOC105155295 [Sesamum indicum]XP_011092728.1 uncharacterized protein LOC105172845 [Sesamum indicum]XP_011092736.1 uncharacterized protein LOC105172848 [Sesamum indicum]